MPPTIRIRRITRNKSLGLSSMTFSRRSRKSQRTTEEDNLKLSETLSRIDETDESSSSSSFENIDNIQSTVFLRSCIGLLSDVNNKEKNRMGLKKLLNPPQHKIYDYKMIIAKAIVYGGVSKDSIEQDLRICLHLFLACGDGENSIISDNDDDDRRDDIDEGRRFVENDMALCHLSLQLVARSLEWILSLDSEDHQVIDFRDPFMKLVITTIVKNVEMVADDAEITGLALKCLRLLHSLEPILVKPMLQLSLMPYLIYLREFGKQEKVPSIESEAARLIERGDIIASRFIEI